jgi:hypothetical protein
MTGLGKWLVVLHTGMSLMAATMGIALFATELISRRIVEGYQNEELYDFLQKSILVALCFHLCEGGSCQTRGTVHPHHQTG